MKQTIIWHEKNYKSQQLQYNKSIERLENKITKLRNLISKESLKLITYKFQIQEAKFRKLKKFDNDTFFIMRQYM